MNTTGLLTKKFIEKAIAIHGNTYNYTRVEFISRRTDVEIICKIHGVFLQSPEKHLLKRGCQKCGGTARKTTESFIVEARGVHGSKYDYRAVEYRNKETEVTIICPKHGEFRQLPVVHLRGGLCRKCAYENRADKRRLDIRELLQRFENVHKNEYDYRQVEYVNNRTPVKIICREHGPFFQLPDEHIKHNGCRICHPRDYSYLKKYVTGPLQARKAEVLSNARVVELAKKHHETKYDYSLIQEAKRSDDVTIICPEHGEFSQNLGNHLFGSGCRACGFATSAVARLLTFESFQLRANEIHRGKYEYYENNWAGGRSEVTIICPVHGRFDQIAQNHLTGHGCPDCGTLQKAAKRRQDPEILLAKLRHRHDAFYDYDLTNFRSVNKNITIYCPEHGPFPQTPNNHLAGKGCPSCRNLKIGNALRADPAYVVEKFREMHGDQFDYSLVAQHYVNADTPVPIICRVHGQFWQEPYNHQGGRRCPVCKESNGENEVRRWLEDHSIGYVKEWTEHDCVDSKPLRFDFYIPDYDAVVEFDGIQHYEADSRWWEPDQKKRQDATELLQLHDWLKDEWCKENGLAMVRIRYDQDVSGVLAITFDLPKGGD